MGRQSDNTYSLVADVGGTNTRVALAEGTKLLQSSIRKYANTDYPGLEAVLNQYIEDEGEVDCGGACVAVAGPVQDGVGELTNIDWRIDNAALIRATKAEKVDILNDLQAQGYALGHIDPAKTLSVIKGPKPKLNATMQVMGVGTGMGSATSYYTKSGRMVAPSEMGHASLPIRTEEELRFAIYVEAFHGFPSVEDALSGNGLENIYRWLGYEAGDERQLSAANIMAGVNNGTDARAEKAAQMFVKFLGTVAGNLSLIHLPFGGMFLIGGVMRAMSPHFERFGFAEAYRDKGRLSDFMDEFSVSVIEDDFAALIGCASHLIDLD